jgi:SAM-dependent methyltransferase
MTPKFLELHRCEGLPVFQNRVYPTPEEARACATGDVLLAQNLETGLIANLAFNPDLIVYDAFYQNEQAHSAAFQDHLDAVLGLIDRHFHGCSLIEVGCGKGVFLEKLSRRGYAVTGMDPAYEGANPAIRKEYFTPAAGVRGDGLILRHVLEHIQDPYAFLQLLRDSNGGGGRIYIEVPCFDWICSNRSWFDVFYEHVNYFRLADFERLFGTVHHAAHSFDGQYLSVVAELASLRPPRFAGPPVEFPADFSASITTHAARLAAAPDRRPVVWGAASKGVIFAIHMARAGAPIHDVVDMNPAKQGRYLGVTGLRVSSPAEIMATLPDGAEVIVMNPNYLEEIRQLTQHRYRYCPAT